MEVFKDDKEFIEIALNAIESIGYNSDECRYPIEDDTEEDEL